MKLFYSFLGILLFGLLCIFLLAPLFLPKKMDVQVSTQIKGPKSVVFDNFNNLKKQAEINSFLEEDSALSKLFFSPYVGEKANFKWNSNNPKIGSGDILITQSRGDSIATLVTLKNFNKSFTELFKFDSLGPAITELTWKRESEPVSYFERYLLYFHKNEDLHEIESSIQNLKSKIEAQAYSNEETDRLGVFRKEYFEGMKLLAHSENTNLSSNKISYACQSGLSKVEKFLKKNKEFDSNKISVPTIVLQKWDTVQAKAYFDVGYSVTMEIDTKPSEFQWVAIPASDVYSYTIMGNYSDVDSLYYSLMNYVKEVKVAPSKYFWIEDKTNDITAKSHRLKAYLAVKN